MLVRIAGLIIWTAAAAAILRMLLLTWKHSAIRLRSFVLVAAAVITAGGAVYFRPHEEYLGGQDGGAYLNYAVRLSRQPQLVYKDQALSAMPDASRELFLSYGRRRPYQSKFACGQIRDIKNATAAPWFQPAMPITASLPGAILGRWSVPFVIPFFAVLTGLSIWGLGSLLLRKTNAGLAACLIFLATPLVIWHGRFSRPEIIAAFFLCTGAGLLIYAMEQSGLRRRCDFWLGAACMGAAPFFHILAAIPVLLSAILVFIYAVNGRPAAFIYHAVLAAAASVFGLQVFLVTDTYSLKRVYNAVLDNPAVISAVAAVLAPAIFISFRQKRLRRHSYGEDQRFRVPRKLPAAAAVAILLGIAGVYIYSVLIPADRENPVFRYLYPTDLTVVTATLSWPLSLAAAAGLLVMCLSRSPGQVRRIVLLAAAVPSALLIGNMYDYFMTRYMLITLAPLAALGTAAIVYAIPAKRGRTAFALRAVAIAVLLFSMIHGRTALATVRQYAGYGDFLKEVCGAVKQKEKPRLLVEYSRIAAPFDHVCGIFTLALNNERRTDYTRAEKAWRRMLLSDKNSSGWLLTPFRQRPLSPSLRFEYVTNFTYRGPVLKADYMGMPDEPSTWKADLNLYRMRPAETRNAPPSDELSYPYRLKFSGSNLGLRRFANIKVFPVFVTGSAVGKKELKIEIKDGSFLAPGSVWAIFRSSSRPGIVIRDGEGRQVRGSWLHLARDWYAFRSDRLHCPEALSMTSTESESNAWLTGLWFRTPGQAHDLRRCLPPGEAIQVESFTTRWARSDSRIVLPFRKSSSYTLLSFIAGPEEIADEHTIYMKLPFGDAEKTHRIPTGKWRWLLWPLPPDTVRPGCHEITLNAENLFAPADPTYPRDLAVLMGYAVLVE